MLQAARAIIDVSGGVRNLSQPNSFDEEAFHNYMEELPDLLTGEGTGPSGVWPDGTFHDWDESLQATVETAPDGRRYIVKFQDGHLTRIKELVNLAA